MTTLTFIDEPVGDLYRQLLVRACARCTQFQWVVRHGPRAPALRHVLAQFEHRMLDARESLEWPGTRLLGEEMATVYLYKFDQDAVRELASMTTRLYDWLSPDRPEDLCLLSGPQTPWLASISHERDAWITTLQEDADALLSQIPGLRAILRKAG